MALDDLKETIETLRERIQAHRPYLEGYETRTRQALIDPMLRALGWDVENPDSVQLEYRVGQDRLDYALMGSERPIVVIEAKVLETPLDENETMQVLNYANKAAIPYMVLTNGDHWRMLEVFKQARIEDRVLMEFRLTRDEPYACALQALGIWRPNLASGKLPKEAATPVLVKPSHDEPEPATPEQSSTSPGSEQEAVDSSNNGDWISLTSLKVEKGQQPPENAKIKLPDLSTKPIWSWVNVWDNVAEYLIETGRISAQDCPIGPDNSVIYFLHTEPHHRNGTDFGRPKEIRNGLWLARSFATAQKTVKTSCWLLEKFGVNPSTVLVSTNPS